MLNDSILALDTYASKSIARKAEKDARVISLSIGEPVFGPPQAAKEALQGLMRADIYVPDLKRYEASLGSPSLREAISDYYRQYFDWNVNPQAEVLVTHGGAGALTAAILSCSNPGEDILIGDPSYMLYRRLVTVLGRTPVLIPRRASDGYRWNAERISRAVSERTAAVIVNSPENPTGYIWEDSDLRSVLAVCEERGLMLIHDEVYDQFTFTGSHQPAGLVGGLDHVIQVNSTSKKFGVPGLRIGWLVSNAKVVALASKAQDYTMLAVGAFGERAAEALLRCPNLASWFDETRADLRRRVALTVERLSAMPGFSFSSEVSGGMFAFPLVEGLAGRLGLPRGTSAGDAVAGWLLERAQVAVVPGSVYGREGASSIRLVLCGPEAELHQAFERFEQALSILT